MDVNTIYYIEVNSICIIIMVILQIYLGRNAEKYSTSSKVFNHLLWSTVALCVSDIFTGILDGKSFFGAKAIIEILNLIYYETMTVIGFLWLLYILIKFEKVKKLNKTIALWSIPLVAFSILVIINPFTHLLFTIDSNNVYHRNGGAIFHWIVTWFYLFTSSFVVIKSVLHEKNKAKKNRMINYFYFFIAPFVAGIIQMFFYGITLSQVGITISILIFSLTEQSKMIFSDSLTGLNNRHSFNEYISNRIQHHSNSELIFLMIDINNFKYINDKYGHITGDYALIKVSNTLKECANLSQEKLFICRYGGDEFLIVAYDSSVDKIETLKKQINEKFAQSNMEDYPYDLNVSIGISHGIIHDHDEVQKLIHSADLAMYKEKNQISFNKESY